MRLSTPTEDPSCGRSGNDAMSEPPEHRIGERRILFEEATWRRLFVREIKAASLTRCARSPECYSRIPFRRIHAHQPAHEEIMAPSCAVRSRGAVAAIGGNEQIEVFSRRNQRVDDLERRRRVDVRVHFADREIEM